MEWGREGGGVGRARPNMKHRKLPIRHVFSGCFDWPCPTDAQAHNRCAFALMQVLLSLLNPDPCPRRPRNPELGDHGEWDAYVSIS